MQIAGLLSSASISVGLRRGLIICIFHQFPGNAAGAALSTNRENHCSLPISARGRKMATRAAMFAGHSSSHQERLTLAPLPTSWETELTALAAVRNLPWAVSYGQTHS